MIDKAYRWNNKFRITRGRKFFDKDMKIVFPPDSRLERKSGFYISRSMCVDHNAVIYEINNQNLSYAAGRLFSCREAERPGFCEKLRFNQRQFLLLPQTRFFLLRLRSIYKRYFDDYIGRDQEMLDHVHDKNPKKKLRIAVCQQLEDDGVRHERVLCKRIIAKGKNEIAKTMKWMRLFTSFGPASALQAGWLMSVMKKAQASTPIFVNGGIIEFVKSPTFSSMSLTFTELINPSFRFHAAVFSDDCSIGFRVGNDIYHANLDISSCDASHQHEMFLAFIEIFPLEWQEEVKALCDQSLLPLDLYSVDGEHRITVEALGYFLGSGHLTTTSINTFVVFLVVWWITRQNISSLDEIHRLTEQTGYIFTVEHCHKIQDIQFLKHSPCYDIDGIMRPVLNFGVLMRGSGSCHYDLPGRGSMHSRMLAFQAARLQGTYPYVDTPVLANMRRVAGAPSRSAIDAAEREGVGSKIEQDLPIMMRFDSHEFLARYDLHPVEEDQVVYEFGLLEFGWHIRNRGCHKVLQKDYGLSCV